MPSKIAKPRLRGRNIMSYHCTDCIFSKFEKCDKNNEYQGSCSRGYTLTDPFLSESPANHFAADPEELVPTTDPFGKEYLRKASVCERFSSASNPSESR